jgi:ADP-ribosylglycohydrolase
MTTSHGTDHKSDAGSDSPDRLDRMAGVLLGTAIGDTLGLLRLGLSARRVSRLYGSPPLRHRFLFGRGMVSDDTERTCLVGQALLRAPRDPDRFVRSLAWGLRSWLLSLPSGRLRGKREPTTGFAPA